MQDKHAHHDAPLTPDDNRVLAQLLEVLRGATISHGRAVYLFGVLTGKLIEYAVDEHGIPEPEAVQDYLHLFTAGMGVEVRTEMEVLDDAGNPPAKH